MQKKLIPFNEVVSFTQRDILYQTEVEKFEKFIEYKNDLDGLKEAIENRKKFPVDRHTLYNQIKSQYAKFTLDQSQSVNLEALLSDDTYTVITAHQPSLLTGPLYFIYKIISAINLTKTLSEETDKNIIPIFILGSEDHDIEEVNHFNLFGKKITWESNQGGPVGRYKLDELDNVISQTKEILGQSENAQKLIEAIESAKSNSTNFNEFTIDFVNSFFKRFGLLVVNTDNPAFKKLFVDKMKQELLEQKSISIIQQTQEGLNTLGFSPQAHARDINLFYMQDGMRERIVFEDNAYKVLNTNLAFSQEEIIRLLETEPEKFSPNVVMRPLYQETIFPNIAYIGGGGELAYWLERKEQFTAFNTFYPCLIRRNSAAIMKRSQMYMLDKFNLTLNNIFSPEDQLINLYLNNNTEIELSTKEELDQLKSIFDTLKSKAYTADKSLESFVESEHTKAIKQIEQIESRIKRAIKKNEETSLNQLKNLKTKLFPGANGLQERSDNFMSFYLTHGEKLFDILLENLNPLDKNFVVLVE